MIWLYIVLPLAAYLLGSFSFAWLAGTIKGVNLREHGSGNLGATNAGRVLGGKWFAIVFLADVAKGVIPALVAKVAPGWFDLAPSGLQVQLLVMAAAAGAILGHVFTLWHGFRGGKAVATSLGVLIGMVPVVAAIAFGVWLICWLVGAFVLKRGKSASVGPASVLAAAAVPTAHLATATEPWSTNGLPFTIFVLVLALLVIYRHRKNILDLFKPAQPAVPSDEASASN